MEAHRPAETQDAEGEAGGWRHVGSHVAVQVARGDTSFRRSRHTVAAALLAVSCAAAVLVTLRSQRGEELAQLATAKGMPAAIRVPGIRTAKQLLAEAARAAEAKKQKLAIQIPGIRPETQAIINSGEWDTKAIEDDMTDNLLPNLNQKHPYEMGDGGKKANDVEFANAAAAAEGASEPKNEPPPVVDRPYVPPPPGEPAPPGLEPPLRRPESAPAPGDAAAAAAAEAAAAAVFGVKGAGAPGSAPAAPAGAPGSAPAGAPGSAPAGEAGGVPTGALGNATGTPGKDAEKSKMGYEDGVDFMVQGHCKMLPTTACTKDDECSVTGGACVFWYCTSDPELRCASAADCASSGGICTGPGHCSGDASLACATDSDCTESGGSCVLGGYCSGVPSRSCMSDSDCGDSGGSCRTGNKVWWEADENFPKDPKFGPYVTWSRLQFHKKLLVTLLKILHLQNDMETQVPINGQFLGQIDWIKKFLASSSLELGDSAGDAHEQSLALAGDLNMKLDADTKKLYNDILGLDSELHGIDATQDQRLASIETDGPYRQKIISMPENAYQRASKLSSDEGGVEVFWNSSAGAPSGITEELKGRVDRSIDETAGHFSEGFTSYKKFANTRYQTGYRKLDQLYRNFKFLTESNLAGAERDMGRINGTTTTREASVGDALDRIAEDGHLETGIVANETATVQQLVQDILSQAADLVTNTSASLIEAKMWKEAKEAAAAAAAAAAEAAAAAAFGVNYARACGASKDQPCPAIQISTSHGGAAERAVDGNGKADYNGASCTHTDGSPAGQKQWWRVDMQQEVVVTTLEIVGRADCCEDRTNGYSVFVGDEEPGNLEKNAVCVQDQPHLPKIGGQTVTCTSPVRGRYVYFVIPPGGFLTLCEVEVFGSEAPSAPPRSTAGIIYKVGSGEVGSEQSCDDVCLSIGSSCNLEAIRNLNSEHQIRGVLGQLGYSEFLQNAGFNAGDCGEGGTGWNGHIPFIHPDTNSVLFCPTAVSQQATCDGKQWSRERICACGAAAAASENSTSSASSGGAAGSKGEKALSDSEKIDYLRNAVKEITDFLKKLFPDGKLPAGNDSFDASGASGSDGGGGTDSDGDGGTECCAAQCTGLSAPLTNKQVDIDSTSRGSGESYYLDRQNVDCGGSPMSGFEMRTVKEMSEISYRIQCSEGADLPVHEEKDSSIEDAGGGNLIFLDRLNVDCGTNGAITQFKLVRDGEGDDKEKFHYAYKCATSDLEHTMIDCEDLATPSDEGPEGAKIEFLDRQRVQCPANKVLQQFQLRAHQGKMKYEYRCCAVNERRKAGAGTCDCDSCPMGVMKSKLVAFTPSEYFCGGSGKSVSSCGECGADCFSPRSVLTNRDPAEHVWWNPVAHLPNTDDISITLDAGEGGKTVKAVLWANMGDTTHDAATIKVQSAADPTGPWTEDATLDVKNLQGSSERTAIVLPQPVTARYFKLSPGGIVWQSIIRIIALCSTEDCVTPGGGASGSGSGAGVEPPSGPQPAELTLNMYCKQYLDEPKESSKRQNKLDKCRPQDCQQAKEEVGCHYMNPNGFCWIDSGQHWCAENKGSAWCLTEVPNPAHEKCEGQGVVTNWEAAKKKAAVAGGLFAVAGGRGRMGKGKSVGAAAVQRAKDAAAAASRAISRGDFKEIQADTAKAIASVEDVVGRLPKSQGSKTAPKVAAKVEKGQVSLGKKRKGARPKSWKSMIEFLE